MKKLVLFFSLAACVAVSSNAQSTSTPTEKAPKTATPPRGKIGAASVKPTAETAPVAMKDHVCTVACKDGAHVYAHGEKGHTCGEACKKMKSAKSTKMAPKKTSSSSTTTTPPPVGAPTTTSDDTKPAAGETKSLKMKK
ncbi:MAG: hypothetical protein WBO44_08955 [Saprospiraceae bacterium]